MHKEGLAALYWILTQGAKRRVAMLLAIDVGNTQTALGFYAAGRWSCVMRMNTELLRHASEFNAAFKLHLDKCFKGEEVFIQTVVVGSVVPNLTDQVLEFARNLGAEKILNVDSTLDFKMDIELTESSELGADRIANAVAARTVYGTPAIVVDFGTATNLDVVSSEGNYKGGAISPGLETSAKALFKKAAKLKTIPYKQAASTIGTNTREAVQSGLLYGEAAKVDGLVTRMLNELGKKDFEVALITTGGLSELVTPHLSRDYKVDMHLTLEGLRLIASYNLDRF